MTGYAVNGEKTGSLKRLNLKECRMKRSRVPFMVLDAAKERVVATAIPDVIDSKSRFTSISTKTGDRTPISDYAIPRTIVTKWTPVVLLDYVNDQSVSLMV